jgi:intracellular multiplication protein IcmJ
VRLARLTLSVSIAHGATSSISSAEHADDSGLCRFCGGAIGQIGFGEFGDRPSPTACALCVLVRHLERQHIDEEASLIWLPEMSQPALNSLMREIHWRLRALGERLLIDATPTLDTEDRLWLYHAQRALLDRRHVVAGRIGSFLPSELADALLRLPPAAYGRRAQLLSGVRLLASGRFFDGDADIYPEIVDSWRRHGREAINVRGLAATGTV